MVITGPDLLTCSAWHLPLRVQLPEELPRASLLIGCVDQEAKLCKIFKEGYSEPVTMAWVMVSGRPRVPELGYSWFYTF